MSFPSNPPKAPLRPGTPAAERAAAIRQITRVSRLNELRGSNASASWRDVLLGRRKEQQARLIQAMRAANLPKDTIERVAQCGKHAFVYENIETRELRIRHFTCHNRFCLMCQRTYLRAVKEQALAAIPPPTRRLKLLTLTQRAQPGRQLRDALSNLLASFRRLRTTPAWRRHVVGALYVVEITRGSGHWWHVHIHAVLDATFWAAAELNDAWRKAARDDVYCRIQQIDGEQLRSTAHYLNKYLSKPFPDELYQHRDALADFVAGTRGRPLIQALGAWRPKQLATVGAERAQRLHENPDEWKYLGELHDIIDDAERGNLAAARILRRLGFEHIQLRHDAQSEIERFWETRASAARPPPLFTTEAA